MAETDDIVAMPAIETDDLDPTRQRRPGWDAFGNEADKFGAQLPEAAE